MGWTFYNASGEVLIIDGGVSATAASITNDLTVTSGNVVIATAGKGIDFSAATPDESGGGSLSSEILADYEEGTWTPTIGDSTQDGTGEGQGYSIQVGRYTKIGNRVFITCHIVITDLGTLTTSSAAYLMGLPFTSNTTSDNRGSLHCGGTSSLAVYASTTVAAHIEPNTVYATLTLFDTVEGTSNLLISEISVNGNMAFSGHYEV